MLLHAWLGKEGKSGLDWAQHGYDGPAMPTTVFAHAIATAQLNRELAGAVSSLPAEVAASIVRRLAGDGTPSRAVLWSVAVDMFNGSACPPAVVKQIVSFVDAHFSSRTGALERMELMRAAALQAIFLLTANGGNGQSQTGLMTASREGTSDSDAVLAVLLLLDRLVGAAWADTWVAWVGESLHPSGASVPIEQHPRAVVDGGDASDEVVHLVTGEFVPLTRVPDDRLDEVFDARPWCRLRTVLAASGDGGGEHLAAEARVRVQRLVDAVGRVARVDDAADDVTVPLALQERARRAAAEAARLAAIPRVPRTWAELLSWSSADGQQITWSRNDVVDLVNAADGGDVTWLRAMASRASEIASAQLTCDAVQVVLAYESRKRESIDGPSFLAWCREARAAALACYRAASLAQRNATRDKLFPVTQQSSVVLLRGEDPLGEAETRLRKAFNTLVQNAGDGKGEDVLSEAALLHPYNVLGKIVTESIRNTGQSELLARLLRDMGQLAQYRPAPEKPTFLADILYRTLEQSALTLGAASKTNNLVKLVELLVETRDGSSFLDVSEFLSVCVAPLIVSVLFGSESASLPTLVALVAAVVRLDADGRADVRRYNAFPLLLSLCTFYSRRATLPRSLVTSLAGVVEGITALVVRHRAALQAGDCTEWVFHDGSFWAQVSRLDWATGLLLRDLPRLEGHFDSARLPSALCRLVPQSWLPCAVHQSAVAPEGGLDVVRALAELLLVARAGDDCVTRLHQLLSTSGDSSSLSALCADPSLARPALLAALVWVLPGCTDMEFARLVITLLPAVVATGALAIEGVAGDAAGAMITVMHVVVRWMILLLDHTRIREELATRFGEDAALASCAVQVDRKFAVRGVVSALQAQCDASREDPAVIAAAFNLACEAASVVGPDDESFFIFLLRLLDRLVAARAIETWWPLLLPTLAILPDYQRSTLSRKVREHQLDVQRGGPQQNN